MTAMSDIRFEHVDAAASHIRGYAFDLGGKRKYPAEYYFSQLDLHLKDVTLQRGARGAWQCGFVPAASNITAVRVTPEPTRHERHHGACTPNFLQAKRQAREEEKKVGCRLPPPHSLD